MPLIDILQFAVMVRKNVSVDISISDIVAVELFGVENVETEDCGDVNRYNVH